MANYVALDGTLFQPESRKTKTGKTQYSFNLSFYNGKGTDGKAQYGSVRVKIFGDLADNTLGFFNEKDRVLVTGRLTMEKWEKDGQKHSRATVIADSIGPSISPFGEKNAASAGNAQGTTSAPDDPEIPF